MSSPSSWVRLLPGVQPAFLDAVESLDAWLAELERRIAARTQVLADLQRRLEVSHSRIAGLIASEWTSALRQEAQAVVSSTDNNGPTGAAALRSPSFTVHN